MAQDRLPQLNFPNFFNAQPPSTSSLSGQWRLQSYGHPSHQGLRPSPSVDSLQQPRRTAPSSRSKRSFNQFSGHNHPNDNISPIDPNLGRDNGLLSVARPHGRVSMADLHRGPNPITRFYEEDASPWNPEKVFRGPIPSPKDGRNLSSSNLGPNLAFSNYRNAPGSELESTGTGVAGDSAYGTLSQPATQSVASVEPVEYNQEVPPEIDFHMSTFDFATGSARSTNYSQVEKSDRTKNTKVKSHLQSKSLKCAECGEVAKCPSEFKKHHLKHAKPYKCEIRNCRRGTKGFTTINDLNRHKKSVHNITLGVSTKSYRCASEHCRNKEKIWPRLDNFKQHINRMHKEENLEDLIGRSLYNRRQGSSSPTPQPLSVAPMDTTLAGIGFESNFQYSTSGGANVTPDQTSHTWSNLEVSPPDFEIDDNHPPPNHQYYASSSQHPDQRMAPGYRQPDINPSPRMESNTPISWRSESTGNNSGLSTLADVACNAPHQAPASGSLVDTSSQRPPVLSGEPQTKAEQQKRALGHLSKAIAANIPGNSQAKPLEREVLRILSDATGLERTDPSRSTNDTSSASDNDRSSSSDDSTDGSIETMTKAEVVKALQALAKHIGRDRGKKNSIVGQRQRSYSGTTEICPTCHKTLPRRCDLKKHVKRHTRPYGCTFPKCKRRFGSKSDWKRHENSQHFQLETWRCQQLKEQSCCAELFYRREVFEEHLKEKHDMTLVEDVAREVKSCRIGRNGQGQFWCGFCSTIIPLQSKRSAAWDERFNHIDEHFKAKKDVSDWLCLEARKKKGEVLKEMDKNYFDDDDDVTGEDMQDDTSPPASQSVANKHKTPSSGSSGESPIVIEGSPAGIPNPRKRPLSTEPVSPSSSASAKVPSKRKEIMRYCCQCTLGPYGRMYPICMNCDHQLCNVCSRKAVTLDVNEDDIELDISLHWH